MSIPRFMSIIWGEAVMRRRLVQNTVILLMLVFLPALGFGCDKQKNPGNEPALNTPEAVKKTVKDYDEALIIALRDFRTEKLNKITTAKRFEADRNYVMKNQKSRIKIDSILKQIDFRSVKIEKNRATADVLEVWYIEKIDLSTGEIIAAGEDYNKIVYGLVKAGGKWLVDSTDVTLYQVEIGK